MQAIVQENWSFRVDVIFFTVPISQHNIYNGVKSVHFFWPIMIAWKKTECSCEVYR